VEGEDVDGADLSETDQSGTTEDVEDVDADAEDTARRLTEVDTTPNEVPFSYIYD
jgi:hypothetical protein